MCKEENLYYKLFFDYNHEKVDVESLILRLSHEKQGRFSWYIETLSCDMIINRNDAFKTPLNQRSEDPLDAFLFWRSQLLMALWSTGIDAVAACGFEDELPKR